MCCTKWIDWKETISSVFTEWNYISSWITLYRDLSEIFFHFLVGNNNKRPDKSFQSTVFKLVNSTHVMSKTRSRKKGNALTVAKNSILWFDFINSDIETNLHLMQRLQIAASSHHKYQQERKKIQYWIAAIQFTNLLRPSPHSYFESVVAANQFSPAVSTVIDSNWW